MGGKCRGVIIGVCMLSILCVAAVARASDVVLSDEVLTRYEATYPELTKITKELEKADKMPASEEKDEKVLKIIEKKNEFLKEKGWNDFWEYMDTGRRVTEGLVPLRVMEKFGKLQDERREKAMEAISKQLKEKGFSEDEIRALIMHLPKLKKMLAEAGVVPND